MSAIYGAVIAARNALYDGGTLKARRLKRPVISVGNISVGGSGKTPFTIMLGELLKERGVSFDVLSRGYRRTTTGVRVVDPAGPAEEFGDEPVLIAQKLGAPVVVGELRYDAGLEAERRFESQVHLLDDGFQHRQLARDVDLLLIGRDDLSSKLLPWGRLREPVSALKRADVLVLSDELDAESLRLGRERQVWRVRRGMRLDDAPSRPVVFCGIARPERFFGELRNRKVVAAREIPFRDHHRYGEQDVERLLAAARESSADGFVTTAKDAVNLGRLAERLQPLRIAEVTMELLESDAAMNWLLKRIGVGSA